LLQLPTEESGTPTEWVDGSGTLARITKLAAFSRCFSLQVQLEIPVERLPGDIEWLTEAMSNGTDALDDALELRLVGDRDMRLEASGREPRRTASCSSGPTGNQFETSM
jgi:hypothetical protein